MAELQLPKLTARVRFPSPAPKINDDFRKKIVVYFWLFSVFSLLSNRRFRKKEKGIIDK